MSIYNLPGIREESWNPVTGCSPIGPACDNCWAKRQAIRFAGRFGYPSDNPFRVTFHKNRLHKPLGWHRFPRLVLVCYMGDLFHEHVSLHTIGRVFVDTIATSASQHRFMFLTKRPTRIYKALEYFVEQLPLEPAWFANCLFGFSAWDQDSFDVGFREIARLREIIPKASFFVSLEPLLGPVVFLEALHKLDWVIVGGEYVPSAMKARPMNLEWVRDIRDQCETANVPFFFKQWGSWLPVEEMIWPDSIIKRCDTAPEYEGRYAPHTRTLRKRDWVHFGSSRHGRLLDTREHLGIPRILEHIKTKG